MTPPTGPATQRPDTEIAPPSSYHVGERVWAEIDGRWLPAVVTAATTAFVAIRYRPAGADPTVVRKRPRYITHRIDQKGRSRD